MRPQKKLKSAAVTAPLKISRLIFAATTVCPLDGAERSNKGSFDWIRMIDTFGKSNVIYK
jgi:hypothetical protein